MRPLLALATSPACAAVAVVVIDSGALDGTAMRVAFVAAMLAAAILGFRIAPPSREPLA